MLREILFFHQFYLKPHMRNDDHDDDDNGSILLSSGYSVPDKGFAHLVSSHHQATV